MKIAHFKKLLAGNNAVRISDDLIVFNDFELYSLKTDESKNYTTLEELLDDNADVKSIIENAPYFTLGFDGGRGSASKNNSGERMGFSHVTERAPLGKTLLNAELNFNTAKGNSLKAVLGRFKDKYGDAKKEYGASVDDEGFVHKLRSGGKHAVDIQGYDGHTLIHNHPSGSMLSDTDLISTATTKAKGIVAMSSNAGNRGKTYHFQKNNNFKAKDFIKALRNASWDASLGYDKGASQWLRGNQRKYGYKFSASKLIGE